MKWARRSEQEGSTATLFAVVLLTLMFGCLMLLMPLLARMSLVTP